MGYTDMIHLDGRIERLAGNNEDDMVDLWEITNGAAGYNAISRHVVYVGGCDGSNNQQETRTAAQKAAMARYVRDFHKRHPGVKIVGHRDLPGVHKACPSFDVAQWLKSINVTT